MEILPLHFIYHVYSVSSFCNLTLPSEYKSKRPKQMPQVVNVITITNELLVALLLLLH